ncbi:MAG: hypothetical protein V1754_05995, partial [Pseudomonadota bacterium]
QALAAGDSVALSELYSRLAECAADPKQKSAYYTRLGEVTHDSGWLRKAIVIAPDNLGAIVRLRDEAMLTEDWETAATAAEGASQTSKVKTHVLLALQLAAELADEKLNQTDRSVALYEALLEKNPSDETAFSQLVQLLEGNEKWSKLVPILSARLERTHAAQKRAQLHRKIATIALEQLDDRELGKHHLRDSWELGAETADTLSKLSDLYENDSQWAEASVALIRLARLEKNPKTVRDLLFRLGCIYNDKMPDLERALASFNKVVTLDPKHSEALRRLSNLYLEKGDQEQALNKAKLALEFENKPDRRVDHLIHIGRIYEDVFKDTHKAASAYRKAIEIGPANLRAIETLCEFSRRRGDQLSALVHLDRAIGTLQARLEENPFEVSAYQVLFKTFEWRKIPDGVLCAAQVLDALECANQEEQNFIKTHASSVGSSGTALGDMAHDELVFHRMVPGGFRQIFQTLAGSFAKLRPGDLKNFGIQRSDRITQGDAHVVAQELAHDYGVQKYHLFKSLSQPKLLIVENTDPPAILVGKDLLEGATREELQFIMGRSLWIIAKSMFLPTRLKPNDLEMLVAAVVRQYVPDFVPSNVQVEDLEKIAKHLKKQRVIPRSLHRELMPFAVECSGPDMNFSGMGATIIHSANRAGLLACGSFRAAIGVLEKSGGSFGNDKLSRLKGNLEVAELLRFSMSDDHFQLRRAMGIGIYKET